MSIARMLFTFALGIFLAVAGAAADAPKRPSVFDLPMVSAAEQAATLLFARGEYDKAALLLQRAVKAMPQDFTAHYNLALRIGPAGQDRRLAGAPGEGGRVRFLRRQTHRERRRPGEASRTAPFQSGLEESPGKCPGGRAGWKYAVEPSKFKDGQYLVSETNTAYDPRLGLFAPLFKIDKEATAGKPIVEGYGKAGDLLKQWYKGGTAAGNHGDLYDNRDNGHSFMNFKSFPQLARVIYADEAQKRKLHWGLQRLFMYNGICIGNSFNRADVQPGVALPGAAGADGTRRAAVALSAVRGQSSLFLPGTRRQQSRA